MTKNRGEIKADERLAIFFIDAKTAKDVTNLRWRTDTHEAIIGHMAEYKVLTVFLRKGYHEIHLDDIEYDKWWKTLTPQQQKEHDDDVSHLCDVEI